MAHERAMIGFESLVAWLNGCSITRDGSRNGGLVKAHDARNDEES